MDAAKRLIRNRALLNHFYKSISLAAGLILPYFPQLIWYKKQHAKIVTLWIENSLAVVLTQLLYPWKYRGQQAKSGFINKQKCHIWGTENLFKIQETPFHDQVSTNSLDQTKRIIESFFFFQTVRNSR